MPSKIPRTCPVCHRPGLINLSQHLNGVHSITGQERKRLIQKGMVLFRLEWTKVSQRSLFNFEYCAVRKSIPEIRIEMSLSV